MSALVHCDGPDCDQTHDVDEPTRLCTIPWLHVDDGTTARDFHSKECLSKWAGRERRVDTIRLFVGDLITEIEAMNCHSASIGWLRERAGLPAHAPTTKENPS